MEKLRHDGIWFGMFTFFSVDGMHWHIFRFNRQENQMFVSVSSVNQLPSVSGALGVVPTKLIGE